jgi:uncharacterized protein with ParB-like and HNH nuclease domain
MAVGSFGIEKESLKELLREASIGKAQLPDFQRGWVWPDKNIAGLIASISLGYTVDIVSEIPEVEIPKTPGQANK